MMQVALRSFDEPLAISGKTLGNASRAELALQRAVLRLEASRQRETILTLSTMLEAAAALSGEDLKARTKRLIGTRRQAGPPAEDLVRPLRYAQALTWCSQHVSIKEGVTPEIVLDANARIRFGKNHHQSGAAFRREYLIRPMASPETDPMIPYEERVYSSVSRLCEFIDNDLYSPVTQAALAFERTMRIDPFEDERRLSAVAVFHAVLFRRGLARRIVAPLSLLGALHEKPFTETLAALSEAPAASESRTSLVNRWISLCAGAAELAAGALDALLDVAEALERAWRDRLGPISRGSAVEQILVLLPAHPLFAVEDMMALTGKSFSTVNDAVARLEKAGMLAIVSAPAQKQRLFEARNVLPAYDNVLDTILSSYAYSAAFKSHVLD